MGGGGGRYLGWGGRYLGWGGVGTLGYPLPHQDLAGRGGGGGRYHVPWLGGRYLGVPPDQDLTRGYVLWGTLQSGPVE